MMDDYSKDATIHGVKYFSERKRHWTDKVFWVVIIVTSIGFCVLNVMDIYEKRQTRPVMISFSKSLTPTFEIPFPAVTVCPELKATKMDFDFRKFAKQELLNLSRLEATKIEALRQVCDFEGYKNKDVFNYSTNDLIQVLQQLSLSVEDTFRRCSFGSQKLSDCTKLFHKVITDEGVCFAFNYLDEADLFHNQTLESSLRYPRHGFKSDWFLEKDFETEKLKVFPHRVIGSGIKSGLSFELKLNRSDPNPGCKRGVQGFRFSLHTPVELAKLSKQFYSIPLKKQEIIAITPFSMYTSKDTIGYLPKNRKCFFTPEKPLKFFKIYSKSSCDLKCMTDQVLTTCGCVKFSMPREISKKVCGHSKLECRWQSCLHALPCGMTRRFQN